MYMGLRMTGVDDHRSHDHLDSHSTDGKQVPDRCPAIVAVYVGTGIATTADDQRRCLVWQICEICVADRTAEHVKSHIKS